MSLANPTMDVLFEVLSGEDGCADHFYDDCCTLCAGWRHLIEHGYLSRDPEDVLTFSQAFRAKKDKRSGWDAQVEADEKERSVAIDLKGSRAKDFAQALDEARKHNPEGFAEIFGVRFDGGDKAASDELKLDFVHDIEKGVDIVEEAIKRERELLEGLK